MAIQKVGVLGCGLMGSGIAEIAAKAGFDTVVREVDQALLDKGLARIQGSLGKAVEKGKLSAEDRDAALGRLSGVTDLSALADCDLVVEAIVEDPKAKADLLRTLAEAIPNADLATTTSSLGVAALGEAAGVPERTFGLHPFNPVVRMELVELCVPQGANPDIAARARTWCESIGKTVVDVPDEPGFVVNRLLFPYLFDAVRLLEQTGMAAEEVDRCMTLGAAYPMGPLALLDLVGLDVAIAIGEALHADSDEEHHRPPGRLVTLAADGKLGRKSGAGFYDYG